MEQEPSPQQRLQQQQQQLQQLQLQQQQQQQQHVRGGPYLTSDPFQAATTTAPVAAATDAQQQQQQQQQQQSDDGSSPANRSGSSSSVVSSSVRRQQAHHRGSSKQQQQQQQQQQRSLSTGGKQARSLGVNQWVAALFKPTGRHRLAKILSVRTQGETGSHLPDEVLQPGLARMSKGGGSSSKGSSSSSSKGTPLKGGGVAAGCAAATGAAGDSPTSSNSSSSEAAAAAAAAAPPDAYEYYVHYRLTNRRLDCWLSFADLLPVNARGLVLPPTGFESPTAAPAAAAAAAAAAAGGSSETLSGAAAAAAAAGPSSAAVAADRPLRGEEHQPKRLKLSHGSTSDSAAAAPASAAAAGTGGSSAASSSTQEEAASAAAVEAWKQLEAERDREAQELKALLFDPSLVFSDHDEEEHEGMDSATLAAHEEATRVKTINKIYFGGQELDTCLSMFEVDGKSARVYSENLCFLAKLFLDHKTLQFDVEPFLFYVLTEVDSGGAHLIGYFSKEKISLQGYNLACILTLPQHQRKGYGRFLISFSYVLSLRENKKGGPERPLSDLGRLSYIGWWTWRLLNLLSEPQWASKKRVSIHELVRATAIRPEDIQRTLEEIGVLRYLQGHHVLLLHPDLIKARLQEAGSGGVPVHPEKLHFSPYHQGPPQANEAMPAPTADEE